MATSASSKKGRTDASRGRKSNPFSVRAASKSAGFHRRSPEVFTDTVRGGTGERSAAGLPGSAAATEELAEDVETAGEGLTDDGPDSGTEHEVAVAEIKRIEASTAQVAVAERWGCI